MGEAREVMDRLTETIFRKDMEALKKLYAPDAIAETPDQGTIKGQGAIVAWMNEWMLAFPDASYESLRKYESSDTAIDEGFLVGTNTPARES
jgi:ketosteroid isomerase-like protein